MGPKVSIIIVARNEEAKIAATLRAAAAAAETIGGAEVIVADSASTDSTAAISLAMGAKVVRLKPEWELSASAGRYVGTHFASGDFLLFIDADTVVRPEFLSVALAEFAADDKLAGACGYLDDANDGSDKVLVFEDRSESAADVAWMRGGCCLYRRRAVVEVGSFNPYLLAEEEADIGLRLRRAGWKLRMLPVPMAVHTRCTEDLSGRGLLAHLSRSFVSGRFGGTTRTLFYAMLGGYGTEFCLLRMPTAVAFAAWTVAMAVLAFVPGYVPHLFALGFGIAGFIWIWIRKRSFNKTLLFFVAKFLYFINLVAGVARIRVTPTSDYPLDAELLEPATLSAAMGRGGKGVRNRSLATT